MEKFHLPILEVKENPFDQFPEQREKELPVEFKIAKAFLYQKYPLTEAGKEVQERVRGVVDRLKSNHADQEALDELKELKLSLPTVENPHLELFEDFKLSPEEKKELFGLDLANVQVTKGCRHQCSHCAAGAEKNVQIMPFPAVLKIAQKMREQEKPILEAWKAYHDAIERLPKDEEFNTYLRENFSDKPFLTRKVKNKKSKSFGREVDWKCTAIGFKEFGRLLQMLRTSEHKTDERLIKLFKRISAIPDVERFFDLIGDKKVEDLLHDGEGAPVSVPLRLSAKEMKVFGEFENYYDSDPFDYRDTTFLHEDGSPADYGDVVEAMATPHRKAYIVTAGWPLSDNIAQRGAEKIVNLGAVLQGIRISIHPYEKGTSHEYPETYRKNMEQVIKTLAPLKPDFTFFDENLDKTQEGWVKVEGFVESAIKPLVSLIRKLGLPVKLSVGNRPRASLVSHTSGRLKRDDDFVRFDVMSCMPGYHVWPDGAVLRQGSEDVGARPQPTGKQLYQLNKARE